MQREQQDREHAASAVERAMDVIESGDAGFYVGGVYHAGTETLGLAQKQHDDAERRRAAWNARRAGFALAIPAGHDDTQWAAEHFAAHAQQLLEARGLTKLITHTVLCSWCLSEGLPGVLHEGNPDLPVSHGLCLRHQGILLENAGICADDIV